MIFVKSGTDFSDYLEPDSEPDPVSNPAWISSNILSKNLPSLYIILFLKLREARGPDMCNIL